MKTGLEYFPLDVDWLADDKLTLLLADYGNRGLGVLIRLLGEIYRNGYMLPWGEREQKRFAMRCFEPIPDVLAIVDLLIEEGFFDQALASGREPVLTSVGIQKRWAFAASRRQIKTIPAPYNLLGVSTNPSEMIAAGRVERGQMKAPRATKPGRMTTSAPSESCELLAKEVEMSATPHGEPLRMSSSVGGERPPMLTFDQQSKVKHTKLNKNSPPIPPSQGVTFPASLDTPEHRAAWERFLEHRRAIRRPYRSIESQNAQLKRWSDRPEAFIGAIENAIANSWQGLHFTQGQNKNQTSGILARTQRALDVVKMYEEREAQEG